MSLVNWLVEKADPLLTHACSRLAGQAKTRRFFHSEFDPYLTRFYLARRSSNKVCGIYLHYHHRGDDDLALHNHPYGWSCTVILTTGYVEERWDPKTRTVKTRRVRPGSISVIRADDFHRVQLTAGDRGAWTLYLSGRRIRETWGFLWPGELVQHFHRTKRSRYARPN